MAPCLQLARPNLLLLPLVLCVQFLFLASLARCAPPCRFACFPRTLSPKLGTCVDTLQVLPLKFNRCTLQCRERVACSMPVSMHLARMSFLRQRRRAPPESHRIASRWYLRLVILTSYCAFLSRLSAVPLTVDHILLLDSLVRRLCPRRPHASHTPFLL